MFSKCIRYLNLISSLVSTRYIGKETEVLNSVLQEFKLTMYDYNCILSFYYAIEKKNGKSEF